MHANKGRKQSREHVAKRVAALRKSGRFYTSENLWLKVQKGAPNECWPWLGYKNGQGYGRVWLDQVGYYAHRVMFNLSNPGVINLRAPKKRDDVGFLRHSCDNPSCCNPNHLSIGTHADNMHDKVDRDRSKIWKHSTKTPRAKLTEQDVRQVRQKQKDGASCKSLMLLYGVSKSTINGVLSGRHYKDII